MEVLGVREVAELLGVSTDTVYSSAGRGEIPHRRIGRRLVFSRAAVMQWLAGESPQVAVKEG